MKKEEEIKQTKEIEKSSGKKSKETEDELEEILKEDEKVLEKIKKLETVSEKTKFSKPEEIKIKSSSPALNQTIQRKPLEKIFATSQQTTQKEDSTKKEEDFKYEPESKEGDRIKNFERKNKETADYIGKVNNKRIHQIDPTTIGREKQIQQRDVGLVASAPQQESRDYETVRSAERIDTTQIGREDPFKKEVKKYETKPHY